MIRKFDFRNRTASIQGNSGAIWEVPLGIMSINDNGGSRWIDMGMLLQERKANPVMFEDDLKAAISLIESWEDFEEKEDLLNVLRAALTKREDASRIIFEEALREAYGILTGGIISKAIASGKLAAHKQVITHKCVVDLVEFLLERASGCACCVFPSPKTMPTAVNRIRRMYKDLVTTASDLMRYMPSFEIFTGWRVASYLEKLETNRTMARWKQVEQPRNLGNFWN
jgi:hypothetical protein